MWFQRLMLLIIIAAIVALYAVTSGCITQQDRDLVESCQDSCLGVYVDKDSPYMPDCVRACSQQFTR